jgi:carboxyl-terminal processing protease
LPVVLLVDGSTSSGAELLSGALREGKKTQLVGQKTFGKWSAQTLEELPNGYAIKYTTAMFRTPSGKSYQGEGLTPDVEVPLDEKVVEKARRLLPDRRLVADAQLRTAVNIALMQVQH